MRRRGVQERQVAGFFGRQIMAVVSLFLWAGYELLRALAKLLRAFLEHSGGDEGPEAEEPVIRPIETTGEEWRN